MANAYDDFVRFGFANYMHVEDGPDIYTECALLNTNDEYPYYLDYLDVYNCGMEDVEIEEITVEILEYTPLEEMEYYVAGAPGGDSEYIEERGLYVELDPFMETEKPMTQADLSYPWEGGFPDIIPTFEKYEQTSIPRGSRILYAVGVDLERTGYYRYCFHIDYVCNGKQQRMSSKAMNLLRTDLSDVELEERAGMYMELLYADE